MLWLPMMAASSLDSHALGAMLVLAACSSPRAPTSNGKTAPNERTAVYEKAAPDEKVEREIDAVLGSVAVTTATTTVRSGGSAGERPATGSSFRLTGRINERDVEIACLAFGTRMIDPASATLWRSGFASIACSGEGFTFVVEVAKVAVGPVALGQFGNKLQLASESPMCGVSTQSLPAAGGLPAIPADARGSLEVTEWRPDQRRLGAKIEFEAKTGCGRGPTRLAGTFDVLLAPQSSP